MEPAGSTGSRSAGASPGPSAPAAERGPAGATADVGGAGRRLAAAAAALFGAATLVAGGRVLFGGDPARAAAGAYVPFVVAFNFGAGFAYVAAAAGLALRRRWAVRLAAAIAAATVLVFVAFGLHVAAGGAFERRTVVAMGFRSLFWIAIAAAGPRLVGARRAAAAPAGPSG